MTLVPLPAFADNYIWMLQDGSNAIVVDPGDAQPVFDALARDKLQLAAILVTHHHPDHTGGVAALHAATGAPVFGPARERIPQPFEPLSHGDTAKVLGLCFSVIDVPGHTAGHIAYFLPASAGRAPLLFAATRCSPAAAAGCSKARQRRCWPRSMRSRRCRATPACAARTNTHLLTCVSPARWNPAMPI